MVSFFPRSDDALLAWSLQFKTVLTSSPATYGVTAAQCTAYGVVHGAYATALAACEPSVRSKMAVAAKNTARSNLKYNAKLLANLVNGTAGVTDAQKIELGLNVRSMPTPIPPPALPPSLTVVSASGGR
jgi:hypothetical protein